MCARFVTVDSAGILHDAIGNRRRERAFPTAVQLATGLVMVSAREIPTMRKFLLAAGLLFLPFAATADAQEREVLTYYRQSLTPFTRTR